MCPAAYLQFPVFLLSERRENTKIDFTADESSGKAAIASFPPVRAGENWKSDFTADESGGKAATASFPPLTAEENWKMQFYRRWERR